MRSVKKSRPSPRLLSGGNPQIAKADGDAPVQAYIAAMPGWKRDVGRRLDALISRNVPDVRKAVKWNSPFYGVEGEGWFISFHTFTHYVKVTFFRGTSLRPMPPGESKSKDVRYLDLREHDTIDETQLAKWIRQAAALPGCMTRRVGVAATIMAIGLSTVLVLAQAPERPPVATVQQLMRSIFFINANVVFAGQVNDPAAMPRDGQSSLSTNPLTGLYGGWQALENSGLALADSAELLNARGRFCSNGTPAPVQEDQWKMAVEGLRTAGIAATAAARARSQEKIFEVSEQLTNACAACHRLYRQRDNFCVSPR